MKVQNVPALKKLLNIILLIDKFYRMKYIIIPFLLSISFLSAQNKLQKSDCGIAFHFDPPQKIGINTNYIYNMNSFLFAEAYCAASNDFISKTEKYIKRSYNIHSSAKAGIGITLGKKNVKYMCSFMIGIVAYFVKESLDNPSLPKQIYINSYAKAASGITQKICIGKKRVRYFVSLYLPVTPIDIKYDYKNFTSLEIGLLYRIDN